MPSSPTNNPSASMLEHSRSSWPARPAEPPSRPCREIKPRVGLLAALLAGLACVRAIAATPTPAAHASGNAPVRIDVTKIQPKTLLPKHLEHADYVVDINKLGQVSHVKPGRVSDSATFNAQTYGNALQAFIRAPDGSVVVGTYRLTYDYDPKTARVKRDVTLLRPGGVNPDAKGAAVVLMEKAQAASHRASATIDPRTLPDLEKISAPTPAPKPS